MTMTTTGQVHGRSCLTDHQSQCLQTLITQRLKLSTFYNMCQMYANTAVRPSAAGAERVLQPYRLSTECGMIPIAPRTMYVNYCIVFCVEL